MGFLRDMKWGRTISDPLAEMMTLLQAEPEPSQSVMIQAAVDLRSAATAAIELLQGPNLSSTYRAADAQRLDGTVTILSIAEAVEGLCSRERLNSEQRWAILVDLQNAYAQATQS